jgi:cathepsin D
MTRFTDVIGARENEPGGVFTLGGRNTSLFSGEVEFLDLAVTVPSFWLLPVTCEQYPQLFISFVLNTRRSLNRSGEVITPDLWKNISCCHRHWHHPYWRTYRGRRSVLGSSSWLIPCTVEQPWFLLFPYVLRGVYSICMSPVTNFEPPLACRTSLNVTISFGGRDWPISEEDMNFGRIAFGSSNCVGAIFDLSRGTNIGNSGGPGWVVGATFLVRLSSMPPALFTDPGLSP